MKKYFVPALAILLLLVSFPVFAMDGMMMSTKEYYSLANRKTYRLGLRAMIISPTRDELINKQTTYDFGFEFDAKLNENLDTGPRIGYSAVKVKTATVDGTYNLLRFGYGGRIYMMYWGETASTHGLMNAYINMEMNYYTANKTETGLLSASPQNFSGLGGLVGLGIEFAFGPNTSAFIDADIQRTSIHSATNEELPLDGYVICAGTRLAFF